MKILSRNDNGFFLMVKSGLIDKYSHVLDMERAVYDTIMLDNAVRLARDWARGRGDDTLILVVADHNHPVGPGVHPYGETEKSGQIALDPAVERSITLNSRVGFASISAGAL